MASSLFLSPMFKSLSVVESILRHITLKSGGDVITSGIHGEHVTLRRPNLPDHRFVGNEDLTIFASESNIDLLSNDPANNAEAFGVMSHLRGHHALTSALAKELQKGKARSAELIDKLTKASEKTKIKFNSQENVSNIIRAVISGSPQLQRHLRSWTSNIPMSKEQLENRSIQTAQKITQHLYNLGYIATTEKLPEPKPAVWDHEMIDNLETIRAASSSARGFAHRVHGYLARNGISMLSNIFISQYPQATAMAVDVIEPYCQRLLMSAYKGEIEIGNIPGHITLISDQLRYPAQDIKPIKEQENSHYGIFEHEVVSRAAIKESQGRTRMMLYAGIYLKGPSVPAYAADNIVYLFNDLHSRNRTSVDDLVTQETLRNVVFSRTQIERMKVVNAPGMPIEQSRLDWMLSTQASLKALTGLQSPERFRSKLEGVLSEIERPINEQIDFQKAVYIFTTRYQNTLVEVYQRVRAEIASMSKNYSGQIEELDPSDPHAKKAKELLSTLHASIKAIDIIQNDASTSPLMEDIARQVKEISVLHSFMWSADDIDGPIKKAIKNAKSRPAAPEIQQVASTIVDEVKNEIPTPTTTDINVDISENIPNDLIDQKFIDAGWFGLKDQGLSNSDPDTGGSIERSATNGLWFCQFNNHDIEPLSGLLNQNDAFEAFQDAIKNYHLAKENAQKSTISDTELEREEISQPATEHATQQRGSDLTSTTNQLSSVDEAFSNQPTHEPITTEEPPVQIQGNLNTHPPYEMTLEEYQEKSLNEHAYKDDLLMQSNNDLLAEAKNGWRDEWVNYLLSRSQEHSLTTEVIDSYVKEFGQDRLLSVFRGQYESGIKNYVPSEQRLYLLTYSKALAKHKASEAASPTAISTGDFRAYYLKSVEAAIKAGEKIPSNVLKEYEKAITPKETKPKTTTQAAENISDVNKSIDELSSENQLKKKPKKETKQESVRDDGFDPKVHEKTEFVDVKKVEIKAPVNEEKIELPKINLTEVEKVFGQISQQDFNEKFRGNESPEIAELLKNNAYAMFEKSTIGMLDGIDVKPQYEETYELISTIFDSLFEGSEYDYASVGARTEAFQIASAHLLTHPKNKSILDAAYSELSTISSNVSKFHSILFEVGAEYGLNKLESLSLVMVTPYSDLFIGELSYPNPSCLEKIRNLSTNEFKNELQSGIQKISKTMPLSDLHFIRRQSRILIDMSIENPTLSIGVAEISALISPVKFDQQKNLNFTDFSAFRDALRDDGLFELLTSVSSSIQNASDIEHKSWNSLHGIKEKEVKAAQIKPRISSYQEPILEQDPLADRVRMKM